MKAEQVALVAAGAGAVGFAVHELTPLKTGNEVLNFFIGAGLAAAAYFFVKVDVVGDVAVAIPAGYAIAAVL